MKTKIFGLIVATGAALLLSSCNDYLDLNPTDSQSDKLAWSNVTNAELVVNNFYEDVAYLGSFNTGQCVAGMTEALTDEFKYGSMTYNALCYIPSEIAYGGTTLSPTYVAAYLGTWSKMYTYISRVNQCIHNLKKFGALSADDSKRIEAELRFFRAFYYFDLIKRYHDVILYDDNMDAYAKDTPLTKEADCWEFVYQDLKYAGQNLPVSIVPNGRVTSGAAYAILSRAMLYAERWPDAKEAALAVMGMGYSMSATDLNAPFKVGGEGAIFQYCYNLNSVTHNFDNYYAPGGDKKLDNNSLSGGYGIPTQEMVESFELKTGGKPDWSSWHNVNGTTATPPYDNLEPRFAQTILYNGSTWKNRTLEPFVGGVDGYAEWKVVTTPEGKTCTGYYLRKLVDETHSFAKDQRCTQPWTAIRYAEVLLNYAEACYHLSDPTEALAKVNDVRTRPAVNLPGLKGLTGESLMAAIRQERKVELAYEGQYYWDMRRWKLADTAFTGIRVHGLKIEKNANGTFTYYYIECDTENRNFPKKMYGTPLPDSELSNNKSVTQYSDWN